MLFQSALLLQLSVLIIGLRTHDAYSYVAVRLLLCRKLSSIATIQRYRTYSHHGRYNCRRPSRPAQALPCFSASNLRGCDLLLKCCRTCVVVEHNASYVTAGFANTALADYVGDGDDHDDDDDDDNDAHDDAFSACLGRYDMI